MGLGPSAKSIGTGAIPIWQGRGKDISTYQGGFAIASGYVSDGDVVKAGTPAVVDEATRTATLMASGELYETAGSSVTDYKFKKGHIFKIGQYLAKTVGGAAYAITAINTSNSAYDTITVGTTLGAGTAGDKYFASTATGASAAALPACNGLVYDDVTANGVTSISVVFRGIVYARRIPYYSAALAALAGLAKIQWSQSK